MTPPKKIHIVGGPGSGKTTLARQLSARLNIPFTELDVVGYEGGFGPQYGLEERLAAVAKLASEPMWITEGIFVGWTGELFEAADEIVWLDLPWRVAAWRIFWRHLRAEVARTNRHPGWLKLWRFLKWVRLYYTAPLPASTFTVQPDDQESRALTARYLASFQAKVVQCHRPAEVRDYLTRPVMA